MTLLVCGSLGSATLKGNTPSAHNNLDIRTSQSDNTVSVTIPIGSYQITTSSKGDELSVDNFGTLLVPGKPALPSKIVEIAIPPGATIVSVTYTTPAGVTLPGRHYLAPSPLPQVIGTENQQIAQQQQQYEQNYQAVYSRNAPYPSHAAEFLQTAHYRKYTLADVRITPFSYQPVAGIITFFPELTILVKYTPAPQGFLPMNDNLLATERLAKEYILNYDQAQTWYSSKAPATAGLHDFVIITLDSLTSSITPLVDWETWKGRTVEVVTTSWIASNYDGVDLAQKTRNFLRDKYPSDQWGIQDCLLIGGYDDVPMRRCAQDLGYGQPRTDLYYAELSLPDDQSWDSNNNHQWGDDGDNIDFTTEISVGRIPWSDPAIVQHICEKSVAYEQSTDPTYKNNILLCGAFFWEDTDNAVLMDYKTDPTNNPWMASWNRTRLYEHGYSSHEMDYDLTYDNVKNIWSTGTYAFVDWAGHGSPTECVRYHPYETDFVNTDTCPSLNDAYPSIVFADACSNSDTDYQNIGQMMLKQGAVGFLGATQVALGCPGWSNKNSGSSQSLDYYFTSAVTSGNFTQGQALQEALHQMYINNLWDYVKYEMFEWGSIWGNPDLGIGQTSSPGAPETPNAPTGPTTGTIYDTYTFTATTPDDPDGSLIYLRWDCGNGTVSDWSGPYQEGQQVVASFTWYTPGLYAIRVKAKDVNNSESRWSPPLNATIDFQPRLGFTKVKGGVGIHITLHNNMEEPLYNITWTVRLDGGRILYSAGTSGLIQTLSGFENVSVATGLIMGFGRITIMVNA
ncbi:MAG TPA: C25 family cysteine peptidase, partial [Candidatus Thermoplasmatota archaeon]|nr:C25 family cysteine peptidase [Candidatus Thermoplasmatota archaeon]